MNYTKGEWKANKSPSGDWVIATDDELVCREARHINAHLISAAPDMYEALRGMEVLYTEYCQLNPDPNTESWDIIQEIIRQERKAIAKAEGK